MKTVLDLGQCDPDHGSIKRVVESLGLKVVRAATANEAKEILSREQVALVLVNRIFDLDGGSGIDFIADVKRLIKSGGVLNPKLNLMLVSNYPEYQERAVALGALSGFGKAALGDAATGEVILRGVVS
jgi:two-component system chemotaxis response regulator CheY